MKKNIISILVTVLVLYAGTALVLLPHEQAFNPKEQTDAWQFTFVWSMGVFGYVVILAVVILLFFTIRWLLGKRQGQ